MDSLREKLVKENSQMHTSYVAIPLVLFALLVVGVIVHDLIKQRREEENGPG